MTKEEAIMILKNEQPHCGKRALFPEEKKYEAYDMAIKALEQQTCEDAVSRQAVLDYIDEMPSELTADGRRMIRRRTLEEYISDSLSSVNPQPKTGWIPVSERLPEEGESVLTQAMFKDDMKMCVSSRIDWNYWTGWGTRNINIIAWMPLPKQYEAQKSEAP